MKNGSSDCLGDNFYQLQFIIVFIIMIYNDNKIWANNKS